MATVVTYNGVELHNVTTRQWAEEVVYDASGTDLLYRRIHMQFQGLAHRVMNAPSPGGGGDWGPCYIIGPGVTTGSTTPEIFNLIRPRLLQPRQQLQVEMNGQSVLDIKAVMTTSEQQDVDLEGGPKPRSVTLAHVAGDQVFRIDFAIDVAVDANNCPLDGSPLGGGTVVINNRWGITENVDDKFYVTRTIKGSLRLSRWIKNAHDFRTVVTPPLEMGFRRHSMDFQVSPNGLDCEYTIVDRQTHIAAPWPAVKLDATYTESSNDPKEVFGDMAVTLEGPPSASVQLMIIRAMQIIDTRLGLLQARQSADIKNYNVLAVSVTEYIGERNAIEAHVRIKHTRELTDIDGVIKLFTSNFGQGQTGQELLLQLPQVYGMPSYDVLHSQQPALFGYIPGTGQPRQAAFLFALGCYYQEPWHPQVMNGNLQDGSAIGLSANPAPIVWVSPNSSTPQPPASTNLSPETKSASYSFSRISSRYLHKTTNVQLPIAVVGDDINQDTAAVVALSGVQFQREIRYDFERIGTLPEIPGYPVVYQETSSSLKGTLLESSDEIMPAGLTADKTQTVHRIRGHRLYALNRPPKPGELLKTGILPYTSLSQEDNAVALDALVSQRMNF